MNRLVLIDGHAVLFRAFHAYPSLTTSEGELVNAVYGFSNILLNTISELKPTHIAVTFDCAAPTFRHTEYVGYKASRPEMPEDLAGQQERVREVVTTLNIPIFAVEGFEADDVIGTLAKQAEGETEVVIVTGDRDALQLVKDKRILVYMPGRGKMAPRMYDEEKFRQEYGFAPINLIDFKALAGDASDEIPGVAGIGEKGAKSLVSKLGTIEVMYGGIDQVKQEFGEKVAQKLIDGQERAVLSKRLATIVTDVPIELNLAACQVHEYDKERIMKLFEELQFRSLIRKLPNDSFEQMVQETFL